MDHQYENLLEDAVKMSSNNVELDFMTLAAACEAVMNDLENEPDDHMTRRKMMKILRNIGPTGYERRLHEIVRMILSNKVLTKSVKV